MAQTSHSVFMVRPASFGANPETAASNTFQKTLDLAQSDIRDKAIDEFDAAVSALRNSGVDVIVLEDTLEPVKPDAVFPNNWFSTHTDGTLVLYPMHAPNRRLERMADLVDELKAQFQVTRIIDLSHYEFENRFLEGTGSIVFDHEHRKAYASLSVRTDAGILKELCRLLNYEPIVFPAFDAKGYPVYHTNVLMCIGDGFAILATDAIPEGKERDHVLQSLRNDGHEIVSIDQEQVSAFAGNAMALNTASEKQVLALSATAYNALRPDQLTVLEKYVTSLPIAIPTIETIGGGSVRCTIAQNFLTTA
jgi:hypothetical protein